MKLLALLVLLIVAGVLVACGGRKPQADTSGHIAVERVTSPGGIEAWLIHENTHPVIAVEVSFLGGEAEDPEGQEGLATIMADMLVRGAGDYDEAAFEARIDDLRMGLEIGAEDGRVRLSARMLAEDRVAAFDMIRLALTQPRFDEDSLVRYREQVQAGLKQRETNPGWIASQTLKEATLSDHPLTRAMTPDSVGAIDDAALRDAQKNLLTRQRMQVVVTGAIDAKTLGQMLDQTFGALPSGPGPMAVPPVEPATLNRVMIRALPQPQSLFSMIAPGPRRDDPDFFPLLVGLEILGGDGLGSKLNQKLREDMGLTYGVSLSMDLSPFGSIITGGGLTQNATAGAALAAFEHELAAFSQTGPTEADLEDAKRYLTGNFVLDFDSSMALANRLSYYRYLGRDANYINVRNQQITAVTMTDVRRAVATWLNPTHFTAVVVGVPEGVQPQSAFAK
jgi:zinc protease